MKNVAVDAHSAEFAGILFWRLTVAADARDAVFAGGCSVETVAADAHDAARGGVSAWKPSQQVLKVWCLQGFLRGSCCN